MQQPFDDNFAKIADSMGIEMYQRFSVDEAVLFLRCPKKDLISLIKSKDIEYIQVSQSEVQFFGYQLLQHLLNNCSVASPHKPQQQENNQDTEILRAKEVQKKVNLSRTTIWRLEKSGNFPRRVSLGGNSVGWIKQEIDQWVLANRVN